MIEIEKHNEWVDDVLEDGEIVESKKENVKLKCSVETCKGKTFARQFALFRHWAEIHEEHVTLYECSGCAKLFRRAADAKRHAQQVHQTDREALPINRPNKFFVAPGNSPPPAGYVKKTSTRCAT